MQGNGNVQRIIRTNPRNGKQAEQASERGKQWQRTDKRNPINVQNSQR